MRSASLVRPFEADWRDTLDAIARARGLPTSQEPSRVARQLELLSAAYNGAYRETQDTFAARLLFSFARDVPKGGAAVRELVGAGLLQVRAGHPLRVLDVGAGLGATTWGVARALEAAGMKGELDATFVDQDPRALEAALAIVRAREGKQGVSVRARTVRGEASAAVEGPFDMVLLGQVLSELEPRAEGRVARHATIVQRLVAALESKGSLVVVEPALKDRTRHLHAVRDAILAGGGATLFAPCLHAAPCPALAQPGDWCHEDLAVDLPEWLVPIARGAGLRWEGLTFSYLVLRKDGRTLLDTLSAGPSKLPNTQGPVDSRVRMVSGPLVSKGKREAFVCGEILREGTLAAGRVRAGRLDRDATDGNAAWDELARGDLVAIEPALDAGRARVAKGGRVVRLEPSPSNPSAVVIDVAPLHR
jgi:SAM-dependent methyltransferase